MPTTREKSLVDSHNLHCVDWLMTGSAAVPAALHIYPSPALFPLHEIVRLGHDGTVTRHQF